MHLVSKYFTSIWMVMTSGKHNTHNVNPSRIDGEDRFWVKCEQMADDRETKDT